MSTYLILGTYSNKGAKGLVEKDSDRREAMKTLADSVGAKFLDHAVRLENFPSLTLGALINNPFP